MVLAKIPHRFGPANDLPGRIVDGAPAAKRFDGQKTGGDAGNQLAGTRGGGEPDPRLDEKPVPGDRRVADPSGDLERKAAGRTARGQFAIRGPPQHPDGVVSEGRCTCWGIAGTKQPATVRATEAGIDGTQSSISRRVAGPFRVAIPPGGERRTSFGRLQFDGLEPVGIGEIIGVLTTQQTMFRSFHHQSGDGHRVQMPAKATDATESKRRPHDRAVEAHPTTRIRKSAESDAVDVRIKIGMSTRGLDGIQKWIVTAGLFPHLRDRVTGESSPPSLDRGQ